MALEKISGLSIRQNRKSKGWSQEQLSTASGISLRTIQRIEKDQVNPQPHTLKTLADTLEIPLDLLIVDDHKTQNIMDIGTVRFMMLSILIMILPPVNNVVVPLILFWTNKNQLVKSFGRKMISFQIVWTLFLIITAFVTPSITYIIYGETNPGQMNPLLLVYLLMVALNVVLSFRIVNRFEYGEKSFPKALPNLV